MFEASKYFLKICIKIDHAYRRVTKYIFIKVS